MCHLQGLSMPLDCRLFAIPPPFFPGHTSPSTSSAASWKGTSTTKCSWCRSLALTSSSCGLCYSTPPRLPWGGDLVEDQVAGRPHYTPPGEVRKSRTPFPFSLLVTKRVPCCLSHMIHQRNEEYFPKQVIALSCPTVFCNFKTIVD